MKVNITKANEQDLESTVKLLKDIANGKVINKSEAKRLSVDVQNILTKHDNRKEKEY